MADLVLPTSIMDELVELARAATPRECCGLIATHNKVAAQVYPATNIAKSEGRYDIAGSELYDLEMRIAYDWPDRLRVFYHSHPVTPAVPSWPDIVIARNHPDDLHLIIGHALGLPMEVEIKTYWIDSVTGVRQATTFSTPYSPPELPEMSYPAT